MQIEHGDWWALRDLNPEPTDYESAALTIELRARTVLFAGFLRGGRHSLKYTVGMASRTRGLTE